MLQKMLAEYHFTVFGASGEAIAKLTRRLDLFTRASKALFILGAVIVIVVMVLSRFTITSPTVIVTPESAPFIGGIVSWIVYFFVNDHLKKAQKEALAAFNTKGETPVALLLLKIGTIRGGYTLLSVFGRGSLIQGLTVLKCKEEELPGVLFRNFLVKRSIVSATTIEFATAWEVGTTALANLYYAVGCIPDRKEIKRVLHDLETDQSFAPR